MMKRLFSVALVLTILAVFSAAALAATQATVYAPNLSFSGTTANCTVTVKESGTINATLELWQGSTLVASWSGSGTNRVRISGAASVSHGQTYTLTVSGTVGGVAIQATPVTKTCP